MRGSGGAQPDVFRLLWAARNHPGLVRAALDVASADGHTHLEQLLREPAEVRSRQVAGAARAQRTLLDLLLAGSVDADWPLSRGYVCHLHHFHHPWSHRGYLGAPGSAARVTGLLFTRALHLWARGDRAESAYHLGRATHLLADCWIPHHAAGVAGCGHRPYENWLSREDRWQAFLPADRGRYFWRAVYRPPDGVGPPHALDWRNPEDWADLGAHESLPWFEHSLNACRGKVSPRDFELAAAELVPGVVRYLAGFLRYFFSLAGEPERKMRRPASSSRARRAAASST